MYGQLLASQPGAGATNCEVQWKCFGENMSTISKESYLIRPVLTHLLMAEVLHTSSPAACATSRALFLATDLLSCHVILWGKRSIPSGHVLPGELSSC